MKNAIIYHNVNCMIAMISLLPSIGINKVTEVYSSYDVLFVHCGLNVCTSSLHVARPLYCGHPLLYRIRHLDSYRRVTKE